MAVREIRCACNRLLATVEDNCLVLVCGKCSVTRKVPLSEFLVDLKSFLAQVEFALSDNDSNPPRGPRPFG